MSRDVLLFVVTSDTSVKNKLTKAYPELKWIFVHSNKSDWSVEDKLNHLKKIKNGYHYLFLDTKIVKQCLKEKIIIDLEKIQLSLKTVALEDGKIITTSKKGLYQPVHTHHLSWKDYLAGGMIEAPPLAKNPELIVLAVVAGKVSDYSHWIESAERLGYNYHILGQNKPWGGWAMRTREFYQYLKDCPYPYVLLSDTTDVFFNRPADELVEKFKKFNKPVVMGGERCFAYPHGGKKGRYDPAIMKEFFDQRTKSKHRYPNAGLRMGTVAGLRDMLSGQLDYQDDQAPCFDDIYRGKDITVDHDNVLFGNCPGDGDNTEDFYYDQEHNCVRSKHSDEIPCVMHFPGRNFKLMYRYYGAITGTDPDYSQPAPWWVWMILLTFFCLVLAFVLGLYLT